MNKFDPNEAQRIEERQRILQKKGIPEVLPFIWANLGCTSNAVSQLETKDLPLQDSIEIVQGTLE